jgi:Putative zinc-finger
MTETLCTFIGDRDEILIAYLYDDIDPIERAAFDAHLASCGRCRADLAGLRGVRTDLAQWAPPEAAFAVASRKSQVFGPATSHEPRATRSWLREIPAWAQVAAALLFLGVSAGLANLDVRYDHDGLTLRTGWSKRAEAVPDVSTAKAAAPWRADLTALEQQLRTEFHASVVSAAPAPAPAVAARYAASTSGDADLIRRVRALLDESERRQQRAFSLRLAEALRDVSAQRRADLVRIDQNLGLIQNNTGIEVAKQREMINYLVRASSQK